MIIYNPDGTPLLGNDANGNPLPLLVNDDSNRAADLMGDDILTLRFSRPQMLTIPLRSWCEFEGRRYYLYAPPQVTKQHERQFDYVAPMHTSDYMLKITMMRNRTLNRATGVYGGDLRLQFPLTATAREHLEMIAACLNEAETDGSIWAVDYSKTTGMAAAVGGAYSNPDGSTYADEGSEELVSYEFNYCIDAIRSVASAYGTEYEVADTVIDTEGGQQLYHLLSIHNVEYNKATPLPMSYGRGKGFKSGIVRRNDSDIPPLDRLYIQGGEQNIPRHYGQTANGDGSYSANNQDIESKTLLLPKNAACFIVGNRFYFSTNPTVMTGEDGNRYVQQKSYTDPDTGLPIYEVLYDEDGNSLGTEQLPIPSPCYLTSADGRSVERVKHTYYDPGYTPRGTKVEAFFDASEIYPMRVGGVSAVQTQSRTRTVDDGQGGTTTETYTLYDIIDATGCPDYSQCSIAGETMTVIFQDGMLAGREFDLNTTEGGAVICADVTVYDDDNNPIAAKRMELCPSDEDGVVMPNETFAPAVGDHYVVFHCAMPQAYISGIAYGAEYRALREMAAYLRDHGKETYTFSGKVDGLWASSVWDEVVEDYDTEAYGNLQITHGTYFDLGQHIRVADVQLFGASGLVMRVTGIKQGVNNPHCPELTLSNAIVLKYNWVKQLSRTVQQVRLRPRYRRPDNPVYPWHTGVSQVIDFNGIVDSNGDPLDVRRPHVVPFVIFTPVRTRVSTLETNRTQLLNKLNTLITRVNDNTNRFAALATAINSFNSGQGSGGNTINFSTCINVGTDESPVCRAMNDIAQLELIV